MPGFVAESLVWVKTLFFWTRTERGVRKMSEPGPASDKTQGSRRRNVRTWSCFGQNIREEPRKCPNLVLLRTKPKGMAVEMSDPPLLRTKPKGRTTEMSKPNKPFENEF